MGFEPTVVLPLRLISSQVHSTTLPPLLGVFLGRETAIIAGAELKNFANLCKEKFRGLTGISL